jgi:3,4-dihydroxy-2-butanone 4-phosphate synthase
MQAVLDRLKQGGLVMVVDDLNRHVSYFAGLAEQVTPVCVNTMITLGKGLVYVSITEDKAEQLQLPRMVDSDAGHPDPDLTVSVDHVSTTTGISAFERADTIRAIASPDCRPEDFRRPGHVFPIVARKLGLLERVDAAEAVIELANACKAVPVAYLCEVLNDAGDIASEEEATAFAQRHGFPVARLSAMVQAHQGRMRKFTAKVIKGRQIGRKIGFPTANLDVPEGHVSLKRGAYGVKVRHNEREYIGMMSVGVRPTFEQAAEKDHYEVHIFDFQGDIYGQSIEVDTIFYIREETTFSSVEQLVMQLHQDKQTVLQRMANR